MTNEGQSVETAKRPARPITRFEQEMNAAYATAGIDPKDLSEKALGYLRFFLVDIDSCMNPPQREKMARIVATECLFPQGIPTLKAKRIVTNREIKALKERLLDLPTGGIISAYNAAKDCGLAQFEATGRIATLIEHSPAAANSAAGSWTDRISAEESDPNKGPCPG